MQQADIWFVPSEVAELELMVLGLLSQMASNPCLLEPFRNPPSRTEVRSWQTLDEDERELIMNLSPAYLR